MKKLMLILFIMQMSVGCVFPGKTVKSAVDLEEFTSLSINSAFEVELVQDTVHKMEIEIDEAWAERFHYEVNGGELKVWITPKLKRRPYTMKLRIHVSDVHRITSDGAVKLTNRDTWKASAMTLDFDGAASVELLLNAQRIDVSADGASAVELQGKVTEAHVSLSGAAAFRGFALEADSMSLTSRGGTSSDVNARSFLKIDADGVAKITYMGSPTIEKNVGGLVVIERR